MHRFPENTPRGVTSSERRVFNAIQSQLGPQDLTLVNVRFTDGRAGDVEVDLLVFLADCGIATIEVKGGRIEYTDAEWWSVTSRGRRRIRPIEQARRAKHAVRNYLARQPEWKYGLPNAEWFVALPNLVITGDMGPEGRREQLIGEDDLSSIVERLRSTLSASSPNAHVPSRADIDLAISLLRNAPQSPLASSSTPARMQDSRPWILLLVTAAAVGYGMGIFGAERFGTAIAAAALIGGSVLAMIKPSIRNKCALMGALSALSILGGMGAHELTTAKTTAAIRCQAGYAECLPVVPDLDCAQISGTVQVTGVDKYHLDADGDGLGCEWNATSVSNPDPTK